MAVVDPATDPVGALIEVVRDHLLDWRRPGSGYRLITDEISAHELARELVDVMWEWAPHEGYADPVTGGWCGYQGACHGCEWLGPVRTEKATAQIDAREHEKQARAA